MLNRNRLQFVEVRFVEAEDGESALSLARSVLLELILHDVKLPGIDGIEVLRRLKVDALTGLANRHALESNSNPRGQAAAVGAGHCH